jgi:hypothetical protein
MPVWNTANNIKRGSSQVIKMLRGGNSPWAAYNAATGGTETTVSNYNGTGETWKVHKFTSSGTLNVTRAAGAFPFRVLLVGGGRGGGSTQGPGAPPSNRQGGNGGSGGKVYSNDSQSFSAGSLAVTVGSGGSPAVNTGNLGGASTIDTVTSDSGSSVGGGGQTYVGQAGNAGTAGPESNITGTTTRYGGGGGSGGNPELKGGGAGGAGGGAGGGSGAYFDGDGAANGGSAGSNTGGGGGGAGGTGDRNVNNQPRTGGYGGSGVAIVAYRIA